MKTKPAETKLAETKRDRSITIRLPVNLYDRLAARAVHERRSLSNYVVLALERDLAVNQALDPIESNALSSIDKQIADLSKRISAMAPREMAEIV
jgi:predicted DNA-binding protein